MHEKMKCLWHCCERGRVYIQDRDFIQDVRGRIYRCKLAKISMAEGLKTQNLEGVFEIVGMRIRMKLRILVTCESEIFWIAW